MAYQIPEKLKNLEIYEPVTEEYQVRLDANESFQDLPADVRADVLDAVAKVNFNRYPDPYCTRLNQKFAAFFKVDPKCVTAGNGSDELISILVANFLCPGDTMMVALPDFSMYGFYAQMCGAKVEALTKKEDMTVTADEIIKRAKACGAKMLIFSNPCNPTSLGIGKNEILKIIGNCEALVVVDEAYMDFTEGSVLDQIKEYDNLIVLKTCSKAFGMAAIRLGFAVADEKLTNIIRAVKSPYNVNSMTQAAGCAVLDHPEYLRSCIRSIQLSREDLYERLKKMEAEKEDIETVFPTATNFVYMKVRHSEEVFKELKKRSISIRLMGEYLRISAGTKEENDAVISAFHEIIC